MRSSWFKFAVVVFALASVAWAAPGQFSVQKRLGLTTGDQWEPAMAADGSGRVYVLYPHYGPVPDCSDCSAPVMLLLLSNDNGKTWQLPETILQSPTGQYDPQIVVDPADRRTIYAAWLQSHKREVIVSRSTDSGATWAFSVAVRSAVELDKPVLSVRGQNVYVGFNHEEEVWVAASQDGGRSFSASRVNTITLPGWSLLGGATVDPSGNTFLAWASYTKAGGTRGPVRLYVAKSSDAGKTWSLNLIDTSAAAPRCDDADCAEAYLGAQIALASDAGGIIYALWSSGSRSLGAQRIYFSTSTNGGENWLPRLDVSQARRGAEHAFPAIAAGRTGDVRIAWMDTRAAFGWNTYFRSSSNGGATWSDETRVSSYVPGYKYIDRKGFRFPFGDYFGIAVDNREATHVVWGEGMNYQSPGSIWYASGR